MSVYSSCTNDYICPDSYPCDTTTTNNTTDCDTNLVYFEKEVLPILVSNCAKSGCHDEATAEEGVILNSYDNVMKEIKANDPGDSELFEVITESDPDKIMPPPPESPLTSAQIQLIRDWIEEGAKNLKCDSTGGGNCVTTNVSWAQFVKPTLDTWCVGCHNARGPSGGIVLETLANVRSVQSNNQFYGAISHQAGFSQMPQGQARLDQCTLDKIKSWIDDGMKDN
ncbi:MAG: c-type cytochrome domain-containing protein [Bacteroidia bacterium]